MPNDSHDDIEQLRGALSQALHELAEALTATNNYLHAGQHLECRGDPDSLTKLHVAIGKAIEQTSRAGEIVAKLRSYAGR
jgi:hypothetical protein